MGENLNYDERFGAHTVLPFVADEEFGPMIKAVKNRHGKRNQAIRVGYDEHTSIITENCLVDLLSDTPKLNFDRAPGGFRR